ncbi:gluconate 2-dehydrogenase subunit 3 family protein [Roseinatronobacter sp. S2]|uniref:gluconate 2-dehydrogenase subunit 3 family protein n=1 Tax=Roseinatronobacter sp. S2 TaxID=3035471 RepID=UPI00241057E5|nr:gluconate 2-dehydrogenase subunit 3 family protein [Roseinatronobacter sp. S2]WFE76561.1 gluconate 2-dehydrogenase subunit 3 family protein [Roseinatronobacter sp. S2]
MLQRRIGKRVFLRGCLLGATALVMPSVLGAREYGGTNMPWAAGVANLPHDAMHAARFFTPEEYEMADAITARLIPDDDTGPGAQAAGVVDFIDRQLAGFYGRGQRWYMQGPFPEPLETQGYQAPYPPAGLWRAGLAALDQHCHQAHGQGFAALDGPTQDDVLKGMEKGEVDLNTTDAASFFDFIREMTIEGFFCDPVHGGNRDMVGWHLIGFPGARYDYRDFLHHNGAAIDMPPVSLMGRPAWNAQQGQRGTGNRKGAR